MQQSKRVTKAFWLASTLIMPTAVCAQPANGIIATYGQWALHRNTTNNSPFAAPFCSISTSNVGEYPDTLRLGKQAIAIATAPSNHSVYVLYGVNLPQNDITSLTITWAFANGDIADYPMTYSRPAFIYKFTSSDAIKKFIMDLAESPSVQITVPNILTATAYFDENNTALQGLLSCSKGLDQ